MFKKNDRIVFLYWHTLNTKAGCWREKHGVFIRQIKRKKAHAEKKAVVKFDGNKGTSTVYISNLQGEKEK